METSYSSFSIRTWDGKNSLSKMMRNLRSAGQSWAGAKASLRSLVHFQVPGDRRLEPHMLERGVFQVLQPRGRLARIRSESGGNFSSFSSGVTGIGATCAETMCGFGCR